jgi:hypothetical protein
MRRVRSRETDSARAVGTASEAGSPARLGEADSALDLSEDDLAGWDPFVDWFVSYWLSRGSEVLRG